MRAVIVRVLRPAVTQVQGSPGTTPDEPPGNINELMMDAADANAIEVSRGRWNFLVQNWTKLYMNFLDFVPGI